MSAATTRLRKIECPECGYTARVTRSWISVGLPSCPCGGPMRPALPADMALAGLVGQGDVPAPLWTSICRENGWDDMIVRRGGAARAYDRQLLASGGALGRPRMKQHCAYPGCGMWVAADVDRCSAGHAQREDAQPLEAMPF